MGCALENIFVCGEKYQSLENIITHLRRHPHSV